MRASPRRWPTFLPGSTIRAHHTATAAELVKELGPVEGVSANIADEAVQLLSAAAERADDNGSMRVAVRHATRALELLPPGPQHEERRVQLQLIRAGSLLDLRDFDAARVDLDIALASAKKRGDVAAEGDAHRLLGSMHHAASRLADARLELGQAVDLLRTVERPDRLARALRARGFIELFGGSLVDAEWFFGEADTLYRLLDDQRGLAWLEQHRAWISFLSGDMALARDRLNHAADALEKLGDRGGVGWAFGLLAFVEFFERHFAEAEALAQLVIREADQRGDEWAVGMMQTLLADLRLWQGDLGEAANLADQARSRFKKLNDKFGLIQATAPLLRAQIALGQAGAAQRSTEELLTLAEMSVQGPFPLMAVAGAAMHRGDGATAVAIADRALAETDEVNGSAFEPHVARLMGLMQLNRVDEALVAFADLAPNALDHPFTNGAGALLYATLGSPAEALEHAEQRCSRSRGDLPRRSVRLRRRGERARTTQRQAAGHPVDRGRGRARPRRRRRRRDRAGHQRVPTPDRPAASGVRSTDATRDRLAQRHRQPADRSSHRVLSPNLRLTARAAEGLWAAIWAAGAHMGDHRPELRTGGRVSRRGRGDATGVRRGTSLPRDAGSIGR